MAKILLVDDNPRSLDILTRRLGKRGYEICPAADGVEAVAKAESECPDLILMDITLPIMDGLQATQEIKRHPKTQAIRVIALTAHDSAEDRQRAFDAGCDDYVTKPIDFPLLVERIDALLSIERGSG